MLDTQLPGTRLLVLRGHICLSSALHSWTRWIHLGEPLAAPAPSQSPRPRGGWAAYLGQSCLPHKAVTVRSWSSLGDRVWESQRGRDSRRGWDPGLGRLGPGLLGFMIRPLKSCH